MRWRVYTLTSIGSYDFFLSLCRQTIYLNHISFIWEQSQRKRPKECMRSFFKPYNLFVNFPMLSFSQAQQAAEKKNWSIFQTCRFWYNFSRFKSPFALAYKPYLHWTINNAITKEREKNRLSHFNAERKTLFKMNN